VLAEFASVVDAVQCAVEIQQCSGRRTLAAENRRMDFRIGLTWDVIEEGNAIYGDGVNIAADWKAWRRRGDLHLRECLPPDRKQATAPM